MNEKSKSSQDLLSNLTFCVFDLETTGGNQKSDKIIEIGLVRIENLKVTQKLNYLINPEINIPDFIQKLTHIRNKDVKDKPIIEEKIDEIVQFMGDSILVAHNTSFDVPFFNSVLRRLNKPELKNNSLCTNLMTKYLVPNLLNSNLTYMSKIFGVHLGNAHRALADAEAAAQLLLKYLTIFIHKGISKINHLYYPRNRYELDRTHYKREENSSAEIIQFLSKNTHNGLLTIKGQNGIILFSTPIENGVINEYIKSKVSSSDWHTITIKIHGHLIEASLSFGQFFNKFLPDEQKIIQENINELNIANFKLDIDFENDNEILEYLEDFIIIPHLIPEQFLIMSTSNLNLKNGLIFRFPSHKKRLIQFITNRSTRFNSLKYKSTNMHPRYKQIIYTLIAKHKSNGSIFTFNKDVPSKKPDQFLHDLQEFTSKNEVSQGYPKCYI